MKRITACALLLLMSYMAIGVAAETKPLIEVRVSSGGSVAFAGEHLHLRVFSGGRVEYEEKKDSESELVLHQAWLPPSELLSLKEFLNGSDVQELKPEYSPASPALDHYTLIKISIHRTDETQHIEIPNYNLPLGKDKNLYPQALINLMCRIEQARGSAPSRLTAKGWCTIWAK